MRVWGWMVAAGLAVSACGTSISQDDGGGGSGAGSGANGGATSANGGSAGGCEVDCSTLTDDCHTSTCDSASGTCVTVAASDGTPCDDGLFCTMGDRCTAGVCGGTPNTCGLSVDACHAAVCHESTQSCTADPANDGMVCPPKDMCTNPGVCNAGDCEATPTDVCLGFPVPGCWEAICNPMTGVCEAFEFPCANGDFCCPTGCTPSNDSDC